ncbi:MAG: nucleotidyltransferase [Patescibacteria group bacterium]
MYLQGSYSNSTNIRVDSDVDIVVQLSSTFSPNLTKLTDFEKNLFHRTFSDATYHWPEFKQDVLNALKSFFGANSVQLGNKSIKLVGNNLRLNADIIPCLQHRKYSSFNTSNHSDFVEGMKFWTARENKEIVNYPKVHKKKGEDKNAEHRTNQKYKDLVRIFKNIKSKLADNQTLDPAIAPSYFVECAIYNAPDNHFQNLYGNSVEGVLDFLLRNCDADRLVTASHQHLLFGSEPWQWNKPDAGNFFKAVEDFYKNN